MYKLTVMKKWLFLVIIPLILYSCFTSSPKKILNNKNLRLQHYLIDNSRDTVLIANRGGFFKISKGSFDADGMIDIEIKEAYSPVEILYAGLTTESNGRLLESGGMFYINAKSNGKELNLIKPIDVSIPSNYINSDMQVFKGEEMTDGTINWIDPQPIKDTLPEIDSLAVGKQLFQTNCRSCHDLEKESTGPALLGLENRVPNRAILKEYIKNPSKAAVKYQYFRCLQHKYAPRLMTAFPDFGDDGLDLILDYIKNETTKKLGEVETTDLFKLAQETEYCDKPENYKCGADTIYVDTSGRYPPTDNFMDLHEEATKADSLDEQYKNPDSLERVQRMGLIDVVRTNGRYDFAVVTLGWFNIDAFYEGMEGTEIVDLFVKTNSTLNNKLEIHVFFPAKKLLTVGTYHPEDSLFHFEKYKGSIPLYMNDEAVAFAVGSIGEKIYYGIKSFKVAKLQTISLDIKETTADELKKAFETMKLDGIDLDIITKKRIIMPKPCNTQDSLSVKK
jgi:mono/diheme cytochrome c family protein